MPANLAALDRESYISLVTFRRTGAAVPTPVWFAAKNGRLYVFTESRAGKVKRLRNDARARFAACNARGRVHGDWHEARARVVADPAEERAAYATLRAKYGWQMRVLDFFSRLAGRIDARAVLEIEPVAAGRA
jgi:PPOX class probable F420-dependent enzyme